MLLDGSYVEKDDKVFSVSYGQGVVQQVTHNSYLVKFETRGTRTYSSNGVEAGYKVQNLFWHNPIIVKPPKSIDRWNTVKNIGKYVTEQIDKAKF